MLIDKTLQAGESLPMERMIFVAERHDGVPNMVEGYVVYSSALTVYAEVHVKAPVLKDKGKEGRFWAMVGNATVRSRGLPQREKC